MQAFNDLSGVRHVIALNIGVIARVKRATGVDLTKLDTELLGKLADPVTFVDVLASILDLTGDSLESLLRNLDEKCTTDAVNAIVDGMLDFFPEPKRVVMRKTLHSLRGRVEQQSRAAVEEVGKLIDSPKWGEILDKAISGT